MRIHLLLIPLVLMTCLACGGGDSTNPPAEQASTPQATEETAESATQKKDRILRRRLPTENIVAMAEEQFPDDTGLEWEIHGFDHQEHLTFVEVEPQLPLSVIRGSVFAVSFADEAAPKVVATYALIGRALRSVQRGSRSRGRVAEGVVAVKRGFWDL